MVGGVVTNLGEVSGVSAPCDVTGGAIHFYFFWKVAPSKKQVKGGNLCHKTDCFCLKCVLSLSPSHCLCLSFFLSLCLSLCQKHKTTLKPSPTRSRKRPTTPETNSRVGNFLIFIVVSSWVIVYPKIRLSLHIVFCCVHAGIERQLESNTDERASADLRIRKSQVRKFFSGPFWLFLRVATSSSKRSCYVIKVVA